MSFFYVCIVFMWGTHMSALVCACMHACRGQRKGSVVLLYCSLHDCLKTGSPLDQKLTWLATLAA